MNVVAIGKLGLAALTLWGSVASASDVASDADVIFRNGRVYTVDATRSWATSIAIRDGRVVKVGTDADTASLQGEQTRLIDLKGKLVLPGFHDVHAHPLFGVWRAQCSIYGGKTPVQYQQRIARCLTENPGSGWLRAWGWESGVFTPNGVPNKDVLDAIAPDRPIVVVAQGGHSLWVNSKALQLANITRDTADPVNGVIDRDPKTGEPSGGLHENAMDRLNAVLPPPSVAEMEKTLIESARYFASVGLVGWQDANVAVDPKDVYRGIATYDSVHRQGKVPENVTLALGWDAPRGLEQLPDLFAASDRLRGMGLTARTIKIYIDGEFASRTAALLEPYSDQLGTSGDLHLQPQLFSDAVTQLDAQGFQVHVHAIGDRGVRVALDGFAAARERNGPKDNRHLITHLNLITPQDQARFAQLDVIPVFQPLWARFDDYMGTTADRVGAERMKYIYPTRDVLRAGARIAFGADWPVASANPIEGIEVALTRREPGATEGKALAPEQSLSLAQAIAGYTLDAAYANHRERDSGSIETGKRADLVVLDKDLFKIPAHEIATTKVLLTLLAGKAVHGDISTLSK